MHGPNCEHCGGRMTPCDGVEFQWCQSCGTVFVEGRLHVPTQARQHKRLVEACVSSYVVIDEVVKATGRAGFSKGIADEVLQQIHDTLSFGLTNPPSMDEMRKSLAALDPPAALADSPIEGERP